MEKMTVFAILAAVALVALIGAALLFSGLFLYAQNQGANQNAAKIEIAPKPAAAVPAQTVPGSAASADNSAQLKLEQDWSMINNANVERACLSKAKQEAVAAGYNGAVVFGCTCAATESAAAKSYGCKVSALDGEHAASIACTKSLQTCSIASEAGSATYTFDQLRALSSG